MSSVVQHRRPLRALAIGVVAGVAAGAALAGAPAMAAQTYWPVSGTLNTGGYLVQYSSWRVHDVNGRAGLDVNSQVGSCGQPIRLGLRNMLGDQVTASNVYTGTSAGLKYFTMASSGSTTIPANYYAFNGRMTACSGADNTWAGQVYI